MKSAARVTSVLLFAWAVLLFPQPGWAGDSPNRRVALVIGNNAYPGAPLANPINDAKAMAVALSEAGFAVTLRTDANQRDMLTSVREFGDQLKANGGVGVFYFAGHGLQIKGRNYLVPIGSAIEREDEVVYQAVEAQAVLDKMESAGNGTNLMILDACRDNPFSRSFRSAQQGLAPMEAPVGTLVAFATAPGLRAADGIGSNGLYTSHLLAAIRKPGLKVEDMFKQVRSAVRRESQGQQIPMEWSSLEGDFYFLPGHSSVSISDADLESTHWAVIEDGGTASQLIAYLKRFPNGTNSVKARSMLRELGITDPTGTATNPLVSVPPGTATNPLVPVPPGTATNPLVPVPPGTATNPLESVPLGTVTNPLASVSPGTATNPIVSAPTGTMTKPLMPLAIGDKLRYRKFDVTVMGRVTTSEEDMTVVDIQDGVITMNNGHVVTTDGWIKKDSHARYEPGILRIPAELAVGKAWEVTYREFLDGAHRMVRLEGVDLFGGLSTSSMRVEAEETIEGPTGPRNTFRVHESVSVSGGPNLERIYWVDASMRVIIAEEGEYLSATTVNGSWRLERLGKQLLSMSRVGGHHAGLETTK